MRKFLKKVVVGTTLCMMLSTTAFAAKKTFDFSIKTGHSYYTSANAKSDNEKYAYVTVTDSNLIASDLVSYVVTNSAETKMVTNTKTIYGDVELSKSKFAYKTGYGNKGTSYKLRIHTYNHMLSMTGRWNS